MQQAYIRQQILLLILIVATNHGTRNSLWQATVKKLIIGLQAPASIGTIDLYPRLVGLLETRLLLESRDQACIETFIHSFIKINIVNLSH